jgi:transmembrane sensor
MASSRQIERTAAAWLVRSESGDFGADDRARLETWLDAATAHRVAWIRLRAAWQEADRLKALAAGFGPGVVPPRETWTPRHPDGNASPGTPPRNPARQRRYARRYLATAAVVLLVAALGLYGWHRYNAVQTASYGTPVGKLETVALADGSHATLSSGSRIVVALSRHERDIDLQLGEAYFVVAKDPARPFVVSAADHEVIAVGTRFSVRRDGERLRVVVTEGVVRLQSDGNGKPATLLPAGSMAVVDADGTLTRSMSLAEAAHYLDWRHGYVSFHDTPLATAAAELNRYNQSKIIVADPAIATLPVGGNFQWKNTAAFVRLLQQGFPVRAERRGDDIVLHAR